MTAIKIPDPVYAMIESHKAISIAYAKAVNHPAVGEPREIKGMKDLCKSLAVALEAADGKAVPS
jgi:hypothetical protein